MFSLEAKGVKVGLALAFSWLFGAIRGASAVMWSFPVVGSSFFSFLGIWRLSPYAVT